MCHSQLAVYGVHATALAINRPDRVYDNILAVFPLLAAFLFRSLAHQRYGLAAPPVCDCFHLRYATIVTTTITSRAGSNT